MYSSFAAITAAASPLLRGICVAGLGAMLAACSQAAAIDPASQSRLPQGPRYAAISDKSFAIPAVDADALDAKYVKQRVRYATPHPPGTIVVDPGAKFLYLVMEGGDAMRYGIGVGREGFGWSGTADIRRKAEWPTWTPPASMIAREPELAQYRRGMSPGIQNPLGARALYLYQNGKDTLYRIHGTNDPESIGKNVSSGCVRLLNQDVIDLFNRTPVGAKVVVLQDTPPGNARRNEQARGATSQSPN